MIIATIQLHLLNSIMNLPIISLFIVNTLLFQRITTLLLKHIISLLSIIMCKHLVDLNITVSQIVNSIIIRNSIIFHNSIILHNSITNHLLDVNLSKNLYNHFVIILYKLSCPNTDLLIQTLLNVVPLLSIHEIHLLILTTSF